MKLTRKKKKIILLIIVHLIIWTLLTKLNYGFLYFLWGGIYMLIYNDIRKEDE